MNNKLKSAISSYSGLSCDIYMIALSRMTLAIGCFVGPFLSLLMTKKLGYSVAEAGLVVSITTLSSIPGNLLGGKLTDLMGCKKIMWVSEILGGGCLFVCGFFPESNLIIPFVVLTTFFYGVATPASMTLMTALSSPKNRDAVMSLNFLAFNFGMAVGLLIAGYLFNSYSNWMFFGNGISCLLAAGIIFTGVRDVASTQVDSKVNSELEEEFSGSIYEVLLKRPKLVIFTMFCMLLFFVVTQVSFTIPLYMTNVFLGKGPEMFGFLMTIKSVTVIAMTPVILAFTRKQKIIKSISLSGGGLALGYTVLIINDSFNALIITVFLVTISEIVLYTKSSVYIANNSPCSHRGRINGLLPMIMQAGGYASPVIMGGVLHHYDFSTAWFLLILISLISSFFILFILSESNQVSKRGAFKS